MTRRHTLSSFLLATAMVAFAALCWPRADGGVKAASDTMPTPGGLDSGQAWPARRLAEGSVCRESSGSAAPRAIIRTEPHLLTAHQKAIVELASSPQHVFLGAAGRAAEVVAQVEGVASLVHFLRHPDFQFPEDADPRRAFETRLRAMDTLEAIASAQEPPAARQEALEGLESIFFADVPGHLEMEAQQVLIVSKKDALSAITRADPERGLALFRCVSDPTQRDFLRHGVLLALMDVGMSRHAGFADVFLDSSPNPH